MREYGRRTRGKDDQTMLKKSPIVMTEPNWGDVFSEKCLD